MPVSVIEPSDTEKAHDTGQDPGDPGLPTMSVNKVRTEFDDLVVMSNESKAVAHPLLHGRSSSSAASTSYIRGAQFVHGGSEAR
ncbi:hypothetical protein E2562_011552 [Oryza meyeriana var. granulata]|uniref:Uncharacterized protein n=1 Tax=Oryza meyeriana var. granulata TaxID=110450 RepID=A0A6G1DWD2_9ORYZ|nr:hypothetical protein E2562_011552 [Oryza meyeriana var. granulata]